MNGCMPELSLGRGCESQTHSCSKRMTKNQGRATFSTVGLTLLPYWYARSDCKCTDLCAHAEMLRSFRARARSHEESPQHCVFKVCNKKKSRWYAAVISMPPKGKFSWKISDSDLPGQRQWFPKTATVIFLSKSQWRWFDPKKEIFRRDQQIDYYYI